MSSKKTKSVAILGAGAFGTALAIMYSRARDVALCTCFEEHMNAMKESMENEYLQDFKLPRNIDIRTTGSLQSGQFDYLLWAFPTTPTPQILETLKSTIDGSCVVICSKGLLQDASFLFDAFGAVLRRSTLGYLAGPNFAIELARNALSAADIVCQNIGDAELMAKDLSTESFKLFPCDDLVGAQICGAVKNVAAIVCGMAIGLTSAQNTHAALLSFAFAEMKSLGLKLGAKEKTFYGLCGLGDLVLTASSETSRNLSLGLKIAHGERLDEIMRRTPAACEGYSTVSQIVSLAVKHNVEMPICQAVCQILFENASPEIILDVFK
ncbi:MAG: NAD(P)H-dependent glycerol-3-phosphate dehydrogenase [Holosporales bacterium]|jgi:glycerol-3-phosphate dehydrogenase (NAD(P)+)|nr:NAD(P)H-dependent glycerol-3-phosphate dehydrogenase [Holosporales bacterium]